MNHDCFTELETMTTGDIAAAVDARKPWWSLQYQFWRMLHKGAVSLAVFQCFIFFGIDLVWSFIAFLCSNVAELFTNRFTMQTYSTYEMVDLMMKRATAECATNKMIKYAGLSGLAIFPVGYGLAFFDAPLYLCSALYFVSMVLIAIVMKWNDTAVNPGNQHFTQTTADNGRFYVELYYPIARYGFAFFRPWIGLYVHPSGIGLILLLSTSVPVVFSVFLYFMGGIGVVGAEGHIGMLSVLVIPFVGCMIHGPARFCLVQSEMDRMIEKGCKIVLRETEQSDEPL